MNQRTGDRLPAAVLWDMDGTLVDTEPLWMAAQAALAAEYGVDWTVQDAHGSVGKAMPVTARLLQARGVDGTIEAIVDRLVERVVAAITPEIPWLPGAVGLLRKLAAAGVPGALVTQAYSPVAERVAAAAPAGALTAVVAGDHVAHPKPHPEPYLRAAELLGVDPNHCVAIEDSLNGTLSAEATGAAVIVVHGMVPVPAAPGRRHVASLHEVTFATIRQLARS
jgi:HAD superfamily hydrolase (TIGR01509 family)